MNGAQRNGKENGTGENAGRKRLTQRKGRKRRTSDARGNRKLDGRNGNVGRRAHDATGKWTVRTEALSEWRASKGKDGKERARDGYATSGEVGKYYASKPQQ